MPNTFTKQISGQLPNFPQHKLSVQNLNVRYKRGHKSQNPPPAMPWWRGKWGFGVQLGALIFTMVLSGADAGPLSPGERRVLRGSAVLGKSTSQLGAQWSASLDATTMQCYTDAGDATEGHGRDL